MIELANVTKEYGGPFARLHGGPVRALEEVTLSVPAGTALGLVGPNGAGKSTLIRLLLGYVRPTRGAVRIDGLAPRRYAERHGIAYVSELVALPPTWTVRGALATFAALGRVPEREARVAAVMEMLGIAPLAERRVSTLSKGNLQRVAIAQALLGPRRVMILDEAADGLDPEWIARLREIVAAWRAEDAARVVLVASHNLDEMERMADRVAVLDRGRVREMIELRAVAAAPAPATVYRLELEPRDDVPAIVAALLPHAVAEDGAPFAFRIEVADLDALNRAIAELIARGLRLRALAPERATLEERFRAGASGGARRVP